MNNAQRTAELEAQIKLRLDILREWVRRGVPNGHLLPRSLTKVRMWKDAQLGLSAIGSSSSFTTTHERYGRYICEIAKSLEALHAGHKKRSKLSKSKQQRQLRSQNEDYRAALTAAANKYVIQKIALDDAERLVRVLQQSQRELEAEVSELKSASTKTAASSTSHRSDRRSNNVTKVEFGKSQRDCEKKRR